MSGKGITGAGPGRVEVVEFMRRHEGSASAAAKHYFPELEGKALQRLQAVYRSWWHRDQQAQKERQLGTNRSPSPSSPEGVEGPMGPEVDLSTLPTVERLQWQIRQMTALHRQARQKGDHRSVAAYDARLTALGEALDGAKRTEGQVVRLDRTPAAVAAACLKRQKALAILATAWEEAQKPQTNDEPGTEPVQEG